MIPSLTLKAKIPMQKAEFVCSSRAKCWKKINATQPYKRTLGPKIEKRIKATFQISCKWRTHFLKINKHWYSAYSAGESILGVAEGI